MCSQTGVWEQGNLVRKLQSLCKADFSSDSCSQTEFWEQGTTLEETKRTLPAYE